MNKIFLFLLGIVLLNQVSLFGQKSSDVFPVEIINYNGSPNEFLNIVIMGDGYLASQQEKFINDAKNAFNGFFAQEPFASYKDSINVFAIKVISEEEGASMDPNNLINNYFGSSYFSYGMERLLVAWNYSKIHNVLNVNLPFWDEGVIIVNHTKYGGSGGEFAVFSIEASAIDLLIHEFGHSFGKLADEYWAGSNYAAEKPNMTQDSNPQSIKWKDYLDINGVGIYAFEEDNSWFRPHQNCKMRYLSGHFCEVCKAELKDQIEFIANTDSTGVPEIYFSANQTTVEPNSNVEFVNFSTNRPKNYSWTFEGGSPSTSNDVNPVITYENEGTYSVSLTASNETGESSFTQTNFINVTSLISNANGINNNLSISIYPNPSQNKVFISNATKPIEYSIYNSAGILLKRALYNEYINIEDLQPNVYIIHLKSDKGTLIEKIIKY